ncbi:acyltransferase [Amycolatopsis roodepoortensis]|uniref:acyltransferase family protein n=1 Tax=Amycolatopsis roodepoortensis TaxID=700274 RepID=UPI00214B2139|nr:acyltransferase [Amycolatopsis roodepoortensis]UUV29024.1 acyltransferase [Amycolatopsis roodepoortensis]
MDISLSPAAGSGRRAARNARAARLPSLTGMRFIAALAVFLSHLTLENLFADDGVQKSMTAMFIQGGFTGVGFFFVLSGFVLAWSAREKDTARTFWRRRFFKIYPNHVVTFVAAALLLGFVANETFDPGTAALNLSLLQAWAPVNGGFNIVSWSLSCEVLFYLSFPLLFRYIRRIRPDRLWFWVGVVVALILLVPLAATSLPNEPYLWYAETSVPRFWFVYAFAPVRLLDFVFGILLARVVLEGRRLPVGFGWAAALSLVAYATAPLFPMTYKLTAVTVVPLGLLIAAGAVADRDGKRTFLAGRRMVWLGEVSFAFYMVHWLVLTFGVRWIGDEWGTPAALGVTALLFGVTLVLSWLLYAGVERPVMRRFSTRRRPRFVVYRQDPASAKTAAPAPTVRMEDHG